jgi:hypothetical protein
MKTSQLTTDELVAACQAAVPEADIDSILHALVVIGDELLEHATWIRSGKVTH